MPPHIFKRASDGRFTATVELPRGADGKRARRSVYGRTEDEARAKLAALQAQLAAGETPPPRQTVAAFLAEWLDTVRPTLFVRTAQQYESIIRVRLLPTLGGILLAALGPAEIQKAYGTLAGAYAPSSLTSTHRLLCQALDMAVTWDRIPRNPARRVRRRRTAPTERPALSAADQQRVVAALVGHPDEACWLVALTAGLRIGELLGLRWADVDLEHGALRVRQQIQYVSGEGKIVRPPKTRAGRRATRLSAPAVATLRRHRQRQREQRLQAGADWHDQDLVFPNAVGEPQYATTVRRRWGAVARRLGLAWATPHIFRHTFASVAIGMGLPIPEVAQRLGHANAGVTMSIYAHVVPGADAPIADKLDAYWGTLTAEPDDEDEGRETR